MAAGVIPLLPNRLAYPEVLSQFTLPGPATDFLYDGSVAGLALRLRSLSAEITSRVAGYAFQSGATAFSWTNRADEMDACLELLRS